MAGSSSIDMRLEPVHIRYKFTENSVILQPVANVSEIGDTMIGWRVVTFDEAGMMGGNSMVDKMHDGCVVVTGDVETSAGKIGNTIVNQCIEERTGEPYYGRGEPFVQKPHGIYLTNELIAQIISNFPGGKLTSIKSWAKSSGYGGDWVKNQYVYWGSSSWDTYPAVGFNFYTTCHDGWAHTADLDQCVQNHFPPYDDLLKYSWMYPTGTFAREAFHPREFGVPMAESGTDLDKLSDPTAWAGMAVRPRFTVRSGYWNHVAQIEYVFSSAPGPFWTGYKNCAEVIL